MKHKLYDEILASIGWFDTDTPDAEPIEEFFHSVYPPLSIIDKNTVVAYYTGCFAEFHSGHMNVVTDTLKRLKKRMKMVFPSRKIVFVIAPANADYTLSKYGDVEQASNKYRYDKIVEAIKGMDNVYIDLNPMLNFDRDHNFPDLIEHFLNRYDLSLDSMTEVPFIVCGKDRGNLGDISKFTKKLRVIYHRGDETSSSAIIKENPLPRKKKDLILRCKNDKEFDLFCKYFKDQYESIEPLYQDYERRLASRIVDELDRDASKVTICKDYKGILHYIKVSRGWDNPLQQSKYFLCSDVSKLNGATVLDSDIFSGSTERFVEQHGGKLIALIKCREHEEIIDYEDLISGNWQYPFVDISYRCSMQPFDRNMHEKFNNFLNEAKYGN